MNEKYNKMKKHKSKLMFINTFTVCFITLFFSCKDGIKEQNNSIDSVSSSNNIIEKIETLSKNQILVCAHRAYHKFAPENSLESIKQAIDAGIDIVEVDINTTKDGVLVLMHDNAIDRTTNGKGWIGDFTYSELQNFSLILNGEITNHKIPTLNQVLELAKDKIMLNLDIKRVDVTNLYQLLKTYKMHNKVFSFIWDKRKISKILEIDPNYAVLPEVSNKSEMEYYLNNINSTLQHLNEKSFNPENMTWAKENNISTFMNILWEPDERFILNDTEKVDQIIALKPSIIQTDHPKKILEYLQNKNLHK